MILHKTKENSIFYRFHTTSNIAKDIFDFKYPTIDNKSISVLQVAYVDDNTYNIIIEFEYIEKNND